MKEDARAARNDASAGQVAPKLVLHSNACGPAPLSIGCLHEFKGESTYARFSDRGRLSTAGCLCVVGIVLESSRCRSRFSTQSDPGLPARRCTHWSDGAESHAFGRAFMRSRHLRLHPDHRPHLNESLHNNHSAGVGLAQLFMRQSPEHPSGTPCHRPTCDAGWWRACVPLQSPRDDDLASWPAVCPRPSAMTSVRCA